MKTAETTLLTVTASAFVLSFALPFLNRTPRIMWPNEHIPPQSGFEWITPHVFSFPSPEGGIEFECGLRNDGVVVWRQVGKRATVSTAATAPVDGVRYIVDTSDTNAGTGPMVPKMKYP